MAKGANSLTRVLLDSGLLQEPLEPKPREQVRIFDAGARPLCKLDDPAALAAFLEENRANLGALRVLYVQNDSQRNFSVQVDPKAPRPVRDALAASARKLGVARPPRPYERLTLEE